MEQNIKCCEDFGKIRHHFQWFSYQDNNNEKVYCMPHLISSDGYTKLRINNCPNCGNEIRNIELREIK